MWMPPDPSDVEACTERVKRAWSAELAGITRAEIARGLAHLPANWPPDAPQFRLLCRPAPDYEALYFDAVRQMLARREGRDRWQSAAQYWAAAALGRDLSTLLYQHLKGRWKQALDDAMAKVRDGRLPEEIPVRRPALAAPGKATTDRATAKRHLAAALALLRAKEDA